MPQRINLGRIDEAKLNRILCYDGLLQGELDVMLERLEEFGYTIPSHIKKELIKLFERKEKLEKSRFKQLLSKKRNNERKREKKKQDV